MANDPWTGARLGSNNDSPLGGSYLAEMVTELAPSTCPAFATAAARDAAFAARLAGGGADINGMLCSVAGFPLIRRGGKWRLISTLLYSTTALDLSPAPFGAGTLYTTSQVAMHLNIADPGGPYQVRVTAGSLLLSEVGAGVVVAPKVQIGGVDIAPVGADVDNSGGSASVGNRLATIAGSPVSGVLTGACAVNLFLYRTGPGAGNGYRVNTSLYNQFAADVIPA